MQKNKENKGKKRLKVAVCGIGNPMRGDDGVGPLAVTMLRKEITSKDVLLLDCGTTPENYLGKVEKFSPGRVIIIDAVEMGTRPGEFAIVDVQKIKGLLISTHKIPVRLFVEYLDKKLKVEIVFIGMQPKTIVFGSGMSGECESAIGDMLFVIKEKILT